MFRAASRYWSVILSAAIINRLSNFSCLNLNFKILLWSLTTAYAFSWIHFCHFACISLSFSKAWKSDFARHSILQQSSPRQRITRPQARRSSVPHRRAGVVWVRIWRKPYGLRLLPFPSLVQWSTSVTWQMALIPLRLSLRLYRRVWECRVLIPCVPVCLRRVVPSVTCSSFSRMLLSGFL